MASHSAHIDMKALSRMISQADLTLGTIPKPHPSIERARELLGAARKLSIDLISEGTTASAAAQLGAKGGIATAKRGPEYYARIAGMRKTRAGGRPKKAKPE